MRFNKEPKLNSITIQGVVVTTPAGGAVEGSKAEFALKTAGSLWQEKQRLNQARKVALSLMKELEIPDNASIVGYLCGGVAKSNEKEITDWILRVTANSIDGSELENPEFIHDLSAHLLNILMEVQHDYYC